MSSSQKENVAREEAPVVEIVMTGIPRAIGMIMKGVTVVAGMTTMMFGIITVMLVVNVMTIGTAEVMIEAAAE